MNLLIGGVVALAALAASAAFGFVDDCGWRDQMREEARAIHRESRDTNRQFREELSRDRGEARRLGRAEREEVRHAAAEMSRERRELIREQARARREALREWRDAQR